MQNIDVLIFLIEVNYFNAFTFSLVTEVLASNGFRFIFIIYAFKLRETACKLEFLCSESNVYLPKINLIKDLRFYSPRNP